MKNLSGLSGLSARFVVVFFVVLSVRPSIERHVKYVCLVLVRPFFVEAARRVHVTIVVMTVSSGVRQCF